MDTSERAAKIRSEMKLLASEDWTLLISCHIAQLLVDERERIAREIKALPTWFADQWLNRADVLRVVKEGGVSEHEIINVRAIVRVPRVPNFLLLEDDSQKLPVSAFDEDALRQLGAAWTEALVKRAREQAGEA